MLTVAWRRRGLQTLLRPFIGCYCATCAALPELLTQEAMPEKAVCAAVLARTRGGERPTAESLLFSSDTVKVRAMIERGPTRSVTNDRD